METKVLTIKGSVRGLSGNAAGAYGSYINLGDGTGVKVLRHSGSSTIEGARHSPSWTTCVEEAKLLRQAEFSGLTPKLFDVVIVKAQEPTYDPRSGAEIKGEFRAQYYVALHMQHINGKMMAHHPHFTKDNDAYDRGNAVREALKTVLRAMGIEHNDMHDGNVMVDDEGRFYVIDFSPAHSRVSRTLSKKNFVARASASMHNDVDMELLRCANRVFNLGGNIYAE